MYSSRLPVPAIGDKAHQPSLFEAINNHISAANTHEFDGAQSTELEIDAFK